MNNNIKIVFNSENKIYKANTEYIFNGNLVIISGINGSGKSQLFTSIINGNARALLNNSLLNNNEILSYSFRENINLPDFGEYDIETGKKTDNFIINLYNSFVNLAKQYEGAKKGNPTNFEKQLGIEKGKECDRYCVDHINSTISFRSSRNNNMLNKNVSKASISSIIKIFKKNHPDRYLELNNEEVLNCIPNNFIVKFENEIVDSITRVFTEAARLRAFERDKYADTNDVFPKKQWLVTAPWTEINNLFNKLNFNYRFADDYEYNPPFLRQNPKLFAYNNGVIDKTQTREINDLSDGEKAILKLVIATYDKKNDDVLKLLLLDEYDATLNPSLIKNYYAVITEYFLNKGVTVILTTHSPVTIALAPQEANFYEIFRQNCYSPKIEKVLSSEYEELKIIDGYYNKIKNPDKRLEELQKENICLEQKITDLTKPILYVEDECTQIYKIAYLKIKNVNFTKKNLDEVFKDTSTFVVQSAGGCGKISGLLNSSNLDILKGNIIIGLFDYDKEGLENYKSAEEIFESDCGSKVTGFYRKRKEFKAYKLLLPIPIRLNHMAKELHKTDNHDSYFEIEHYLPQEFIDNNTKFRDHSILNTSYRECKRAKKSTLWSDLIKLDNKDFKDFKILFDIIEELFNK